MVRQVNALPSLLASPSPLLRISRTTHQRSPMIHHSVMPASHATDMPASMDYRQDGHRFCVPVRMFHVLFSHIYASTLRVQQRLANTHLTASVSSRNPVPVMSLCLGLVISRRASMVLAWDSSKHGLGLHTFHSFT